MQNVPGEIRDTHFLRIGVVQGMVVPTFACDAAQLPDPTSLKQPHKMSVIRRGRHRHDFQNPAVGAPWGDVIARTEAEVWPLLSKKFGKHRILSRTVGFVQPGAPAQPWHVDLDGDRMYWTVMVPLTTDYDSGGTEFGTGEARLSVRGTMYAFNGAELHRGAAHRGGALRVYVAFVVVPNRWKSVDLNVF